MVQLPCRGCLAHGARAARSNYTTPDAVPAPVPRGRYPQPHHEVQVAPCPQPLNRHPEPVQRIRYQPAVQILVDTDTAAQLIRTWGSGRDPQDPGLWDAAMHWRPRDDGDPAGCWAASRDQRGSSARGGRKRFLHSQEHPDAVRTQSAFAIGEPGVSHRPGGSSCTPDVQSPRRSWRENQIEIPV